MTVAGVRFSTWDRWFLTLLFCDHGGAWGALRDRLREHRRGHGFERDDAEAPRRSADRSRVTLCGRDGPGEPRDPADDGEADPNAEGRSPAGEARPFRLSGARGARRAGRDDPGCAEGVEVALPSSFRGSGRASVTAMDYRSRIVRDRGICGGEPVIKGTRVTLRTVLASLAEGATTKDILEDFPSLSEDDVRAAIAFAAASAEEDLPLPELPPEL